MAKTDASQLSLPIPKPPVVSREASSTFADNMTLPIHRWFRYTAGFSASWASDLIARERANGRRRMLDPFAGSGTSLLEAERCGVESIGMEAHPFVARVARAKLLWRQDPLAFGEHARSVVEAARAEDVVVRERPALMHKCYPLETLAKLEGLHAAWERLTQRAPLSELAWLALVSILRECSPVGTAQWQYILPDKSKLQASEPYSAYAGKVRQMVADMVERQAGGWGPGAVLHQGDARDCRGVQDAWAELVLTSPPYINNYDYADATRLEMTFLGEVARWRDLQDAVRTHLVRSSTQHVSEIASQTYAMVESSELAVIRAELAHTCRALERERETHGGRKVYHTMVAAYFCDMAAVWAALRRTAADGALVCFVVGDSAPYGVYVPVERWLGELALAAGFRSYSFEKTRDRNVKWRNRKHRVPLKEGRLWVEG